MPLPEPFMSWLLVSLWTVAGIVWALALIYVLLVALVAYRWRRMLGVER
ncbi:MAG: hypothetical protein V3S00_01225 [Dehalococcoidia bacterium]